jgi:hypothetical protein
MDSLKNPVVLSGESSDKTFEIKAETDIIGYAKADLNANNITHFKVSYGNCFEYIATETQLEDEVIPGIIKRLPNHNPQEYNGKYIIWALLKADSAQYEFFDKNSLKVNIEPGSELEKILKSKIGAEWSSNTQKNLSFSTPHFIGYRIYEISILNETMVGVMKIKSKIKKFSFKNINPEDVRKSYYSDK